jgi:hypothetical protein
MFAARAYRIPAEEDTELDVQQPLADLVPIGQIDRIPARHARPDVVSVMGPPNRAPGVGIMGDPDGAPRIDVMGGPDRGLSPRVMGGPDRGPRLDLMGDSDPRFVDFVFTGRP